MSINSNDNGEAYQVQVQPRADGSDSGNMRPGPETPVEQSQKSDNRSIISGSNNNNNIDINNDMKNTNNNGHGRRGSG